MIAKKFDHLLDAYVHIVICDGCGASPNKHRSAEDPGDAAEAARKEGFKTVRGELGEPMKWHCPKCLAKG